MYMSEKGQEREDSAIELYKEGSPNANNMIIPISDCPGATTSGGDEPGTAKNQSSSIPPLLSPAPKKRAETWAQEETRFLISLRKEIDFLFNKSKSNTHLWDNISMKMREKGFDRSPTMCTDKWRNLLKEFKKAKQNNQDGNGNGNAKMIFFNDLEEIKGERSKNGNFWKNSSASNDAAAQGSKVGLLLQYSDKGIDDVSPTFGPVEASGRSSLNMERRLDHEEHSLAITAADTVGANEGSPWNWRETSGNGEHRNTFDGRVITVKLGNYTKRIGIDGTGDAIKETIKSAFRLRTKRAFWLEDEDNIVRTIDRDMPLGHYTLHVDEGLAIKICNFDGPEHLPVHTEEKTFYTEDDFRNFLARRCWTCLREYDGYRNVDSMDELCPGAIYRGVD